MKPWTRLTVLTLLILPGVLLATPTRVCRNTLDDSFFNKCRIDTPDGYLTQQSTLVKSWINPRFLAQVPICIVLMLPMIFKRDTEQSNARYFQVMLTLLNFIHRICYSLLLDVGLYAVFRQHRPCECAVDGGPFVQVGSIYGMPSGDALSGAVFGALFLDVGPVFPIGSRILGAVIIVLVNVERMALGFHTLGQTTVGAVLGILLHFYNTRAPQWTIYMDVVIMVVGTFVSLSIDPAVSFQANDFNNLFSWTVWGCSIAFFSTVLLTYYHYQNDSGMGSLKLSYVSIVGQGGEIDPEINGKQLKVYRSFGSDLMDVSEEELRNRKDVATIGSTFIITVLGGLASEYVTLNGWKHV